MVMMYSCKEVDIHTRFIVDIVVGVAGAEVEAGVEPVRSFMSLRNRPSI